MQLTGKVVQVLQTQQVTESFKKREVLIEIAENAQYPETLKIEALQDKVNLFDGLLVGDDIEVDVNLSGKPFTGKDGNLNVFNSLKVWKLKKLDTLGF